MTYLALVSDSESESLPISTDANSGGGRFVVVDWPELGFVAGRLGFGQFLGPGTAFVGTTDRHFGEYLVAPLDADWLDDCLAELTEAEEEAQEEGIAPPTALAVSKATEMLAEAAKLSLPEPAVYPAEDSAVGIQFRKGQSGVLILCEADGRFACFSRIDGQNERARYSATSLTPGAFIVEHLRKLERL